MLTVNTGHRRGASTSSQVSGPTSAPLYIKEGKTKPVAHHIPLVQDSLDGIGPPHGIYLFILCYRWQLPCRVRRERVSPTTSQTRRSPCLRGGAWTCSCWPPPFPSGSFRASGSGMITRGNTLLGMDAPTQQTNVETGNRVTVTIAAITFGSNNYLKQCLERPCHCWLFILGSFHICSY